ncbi:MAG: hypothetical protein FWE61_08995 [Micrococcales bacterium]|nr:hypothetical protein [Micrococcales bacterium]
MAIEWADSADKHDIDHDDALHAIHNAYFYEPEFDEPRVGGASRPDLYIGPPRQLGGPLIEVMLERIPPRTLVIFHVMEAQPKHTALMDQEGE